MKMTMLEVQDSGRTHLVEVDSDADAQEVAMIWGRKQTLAWWNENSTCNVIVDGTLICLSLSYDFEAKIVPEEPSEVVMMVATPGCA